MKFQLLSLNVGRCWNAILLFNGWTFQFGSHSNLCQSALRSDLHSTTHVPASMTERVFHSFKLHLVPFRVLELLAFSLTLNLFLQKEVLQLSRDTSEVCVLRRSVVVILKFQRNVLKLLFYDRFLITWSHWRLFCSCLGAFEYSGIAWYRHARFWKLLSPFFALTPLLPARKVIFKNFYIRMNLSPWESRLKVLEIIILQQLLLQICTIHAKQAFFFWSAFCLSASFAAFLSMTWYTVIHGMGSVHRNLTETNTCWALRFSRSFLDTNFNFGAWKLAKNFPGGQGSKETQWIRITSSQRF